VSLKRVALIVGVVAVCGTGVAVAAHQQVDPATVPTGFLTAHSAINNVPASVIADALESGRTDVFIEHGRLAARDVRGFRTSPGPVFVIGVRARTSRQQRRRPAARWSPSRARRRGTAHRRGL
jgi:hypothetical protein